MASEMTIKENIDDILTRGVGEFIDPDGSFRKKLEESPEKIVIKFGIDPTRPDIHIGHAVVLHKLRQFQDMGCKVIFLIGDYTAQIGDPTGKSKVRPEINQKEVEVNMKTYLEQVGLILDVVNKNKYAVLKNSIWYQSATDYPQGTMQEKSALWELDRNQYTAIRADRRLPTTTLWNFIFALKHITHAQLVERDMFQKRIKSGEQLYMHEMMYPILQGIDSNTIAGFFDTCDLEVGGTDQTFNMLMGRSTMRSIGQKPQAVLAFKLLEGIDGKEKMSKSLDNYIGITDEPNDMYGKVMSIPDSSIASYYELCTFTPLSEVEEIKNNLKDSGVNPKDLKMKLGYEIVKMYHSAELAEKAQENWEKTFSKGEIPEGIKEIQGGEGEALSEVLVKNNVLPSKSEWRRLVSSNSIHDIGNDTTITDVDVKITSDLTLKIGKKNFIKIIVK